MNNYIITYRCRLCNKLFGDQQLDYYLARDSIGRNYINPLVTEHKIHNCVNGDMGKADLVGAVRIPNDLELAEETGI